MKLEIPKTIHQIWLGDQSIKPQKLIDSWPKLNPSWEHKLWTEDNLPDDLKLKNKMDLISNYATKSILLRWELLYKYGGVYFDTDTKALLPLDDSLLDTECFSVFSNEIYDKNMISCSVIGCNVGNSFLGKIINEIYEMDDYLVKGIAGWRVVGSTLLTNCVNRYKPKIKICPSWYFIPTFRNGVRSNNKPIYCEQYWAASHQIQEKVKNYE